jgi:hypothetical protein
MEEKGGGGVIELRGDGESVDVSHREYTVLLYTQQSDAVSIEKDYTNTTYPKLLYDTLWVGVYAIMRPQLF